MERRRSRSRATGLWQVVLWLFLRHAADYLPSASRQTKALSPVICRPTMSSWMSAVPS